MSYKPCMARSSTALLTGYHRTLRTTPCKLGCPLPVVRLPTPGQHVWPYYSVLSPSSSGKGDGNHPSTASSLTRKEESSLSTVLTHGRKTWRTVSRTPRPRVSPAAVRIRVLIAINIQQRFFNVAIDSMFMATRPFQCRSRG